jgi:Uma2 family endonuclease
MATTLAPPTPKLTYADLDVIPTEREGDRHELFDGELVVTPSPIPAHQLITSRLDRWVGNHVEAEDLGEVFVAPIDVEFAPMWVAVPDLVFVRKERMAIVKAKAIVGAPDLIVEVLSPSTRRRDLGRKKAMYERFGVPEYWIVDHRQRNVPVFVLNDGHYEALPAGERVIPSVVLPRLEILLERLFAGLPT